MHTERFVVKIIGAMLFYTLLSTVQAADGDTKAGEIKFSTCRGCHGIPGYTNAYPTYHVPRLGGQNAEYILAALQAYKTGDRTHPTMHANAFSLSEQDMADIAAYLASYELGKEEHPIKGNAAAGKQKVTACVACHGEDGNGNTENPMPMYPRLAGQHEDYLRRALSEYKSGKRKNAIMNGMAAPLSEQDQADLAAYFASQEKGLRTVRE